MPWIGVDLDGTLAVDEERYGPYDIGPPVPLMVERVQDWIAQGYEVRIFTARLSHFDDDEDREIFVDTVQEWLAETGLPALDVTNIKDAGVVAIWDDKAVPVVRNTGMIF